MNKSQNFIERYKEYAQSEEAYAVLFTKKYLDVSKNMWIDIVDYSLPRYYEINDLEFKFVLCELFNKKIYPRYPNKRDFLNKDDCINICRAITWDVAHKDILEQKNKGIKGSRYLIEGVKYDSNKNKGYFVDDAPDEIKALERNLNDRTDPLWGVALRYIRRPNFIFRIRKITKIKKG